MKRFMLFLLLLAGQLMMGMASATADNGKYHMTAGDFISISVLGHEDMQVKEVEIRPDGVIAMPLTGEMKAAGLSPGELTLKITEALSRYVKNPVVTINILRYHATRIYVLGEVNKPGLYEIGRQHNVLDALGAAGGYTKYAAKKNVFLLRKGATRSEDMVKVNVLSMLTKGDMTQNYELNDGDVLFLSSNGKITFSEDILPWLTGAYEVKTGFFTPSTTVIRN